MKKLTNFSLILILLFIFFSCSSAPKTHFYLIDYPVSVAKENSHPVHQVVLGVSKFRVEPLYSDTRLVYRENPYEGNYYFYHRWVTSPGKMVTDKTIEQLAASNLFKQVVSFPRHVQCDYIINGNIKALEEWDENNKWYAKVKIDFELPPAAIGGKVYDIFHSISNNYNPYKKIKSLFIEKALFFFETNC